MKKTLIFCSMSALLGAALAVAVTELPKAGSVSGAQESQPRRSPSGGPVAPPAVATGMEPSWGTAAPASEFDELTPEERVNIAVYEKCNRSVAHITTQSVSIDSFFLMQTPREGEGSGSVIDRQGHIVTNYHVVEGARQIRVTLFDGSTYDAQAVGGDRISDIAVLKIDAPAESLIPLEFGDSARLKVGQRVYAIGNPFGLDRTLSTGIISSLNRSLPSRAKYREMEQIIQIDAAINPGNSGGPLLDSRGRMIGMNTAIASSTGESAGVGFAIPVATLTRVVPQLLRDGRVVRAAIGIAGVYELEQGLLIVRLVPGGAAERAGFRGPRFRRAGPFVAVDRAAADLITAIDGRPVRTVESFLRIIESRQPGEQVTVTVVRDGREIHVPVTLEAAD